MQGPQGGERTARWRRVGDLPKGLADYHRRWQQANRDKKRAQDRRYWERKRARMSDAP
jgi:hypothetical protein